MKKMGGGERGEGMGYERGWVEGGVGWKVGLGGGWGWVEGGVG